ncbi:MFS transporter [Lachnospiraceae bacterium WCA-9-b2]|uniref:MFS transporter n=1 Tax=Sporofaciens musculi TaxID=2681861 RepID=A0A7X3MHY8_9FIRM|nr:MFS transporter [Sporofaciens musculi]MXP76763.1 MFS transporter [Sporofaciens musculi]
MTEKLFTKNFTLLILGQLTSLFGNFILKLALSMYVLEVTGSAAIFAGILSAATIPTILFSPLGGILADRADRRNIMVALDALTGVSVLCAALFLSESNAIAVISTLLLILSIFGAFETPTVQACIPTMLQGDNIMKGNAVVNQVASLSYLIAPMLGGVLYAMLGLKPVMYASVVCFFITALFECFIKLSYQHTQNKGGVLQIVKQDFLSSMQYISKEQASISKMLLLTAFSRFFVMGITIVGLPFLVRTVLGFNAKYYGAAESALAVATILGSIAAGVWAEKLKIYKLSVLLAFLGIFIIPAGVIFLLPVTATIKYGVTIVSFCGMQAVISIFSIFAVSLIQQRTPNHLIGKVMAYTSTVTLCVQPIGQVVYGFLFDRFHSAVYFVLIPTGIIVCIVGLSAMSFFKNMEREQQEVAA